MMLISAAIMSETILGKRLFLIVLQYGTQSKHNSIISMIVKIERNNNDIIFCAMVECFGCKTGLLFIVYFLDYVPWAAFDFGIDFADIFTNDTKCCDLNTAEQPNRANNECPTRNSLSDKFNYNGVD